jgi:hypothetical protein
MLATFDEVGDRDGAKQNFSACVETGYFYTAIS